MKITCGELNLDSIKHGEVRLKTHRNTIFEECAEVICHESLAAQQYVIQLYAPKCAQHAHAGNFVHLQCNHQLAMRRPYSIMRSDPNTGYIDILYKIVGQGSSYLATHRAGDKIQCLGPIGNAFTVSDATTHPLLLGGGVGIPPMIFLADELRKKSKLFPFVIMGSEIPFPFKTKPSKILVQNIPNDVIAAMPLLDDWGIASRLTSLQGYQGCFEGYVHELAERWFTNLDKQTQQGVEIVACGPTQMLEAVADFAKRYQIPCHVSLEEHMACAVGGCAGCVVPYKENNKVTAMKRVCVDGPIFNAENIF